MLLEIRVTSFIGKIFYFKEWPFFFLLPGHFFSILSKSAKIFQTVQVAEVRRRPENRKNHLFIQAQVSTNPRACGNLAIDLSWPDRRVLDGSWTGGHVFLTKIWEIACLTFFLITLKSSMLGSNVKCILLTCYFMHLWVQATAALERILSCISRKNQLEKTRPTYSIAAGVFQKKTDNGLFLREFHTKCCYDIFTAAWQFLVVRHTISTLSKLHTPASKWPDEAT